MYRIHDFIIKANILRYAGIKAMCADRELNAILYANRAAAQVRLGNKRTAIKDCVMARKFDPHHHKALLRGAECLLDLGYAAQCLKWLSSSDWSKADQDTHAKVEEIKKTAEVKRTVEERDARKEKIKVGIISRIAWVTCSL